VVVVVGMVVVRLVVVVRDGRDVVVTSVSCATVSTGVPQPLAADAAIANPRMAARAAYRRGVSAMLSAFRIG